MQGSDRFIDRRAIEIAEASKKRQVAQEKQIVLEASGFDNEDDRQAALRFQEQCHLMLKWEEFTSQNGVEDPFLQQSLKAFYDNFIVIDHDTPFDFMNRMFNKGPDADILFNLSTEQLSMLVPMVKIYKIYVDPYTKEEFPIELPFDDFFSKSEVANITKTKAGRGRGAGLKTFSWKTVGSNPANKFQFRAEMGLHFQSIEDLFLSRDRRTVDFASSKRTIDVKFADLLIPPREFRKGANDGPRVWDPSYFKIKAVVGWKVPNLRGVNAFIPQKARDVLSKTFNSFILAIDDHTMDVKADGSVDLDISFSTLPETVINNPISANILFTSAGTKLEIERLVDKVSRLEFEIENQTETGNLRDEENEMSLTIGDGQSGVASSASVNAKKKELNDTLKQLGIFDNSKKTQAYRRILGGLYNRHKMKFTLVKKEFLNKRIKLKNREYTGTAEQFKESDDAITKEKNAEAENGVISGGSNAPDLLASNEVGGVKEFSDALNEIQQFDLNKSGIPNKDFYKVIYFHFGDLLDVVLEGMFKKNRSKPDSIDNKEVKVILGSLTFYDYGNLEDHGLVGKKKGVKNDRDGVDRIYTGKLSSVNIADIPISLKVFTNWFNEKIAEPGLETYTFKEFVTDAVNDLIVRAIKTECYDFAPRQQARLTYTPFTAPANTKRTDLFRSSTRIDLSELEEFPFTSEEHRVLSTKQEMENYILIRATIENPWDLTGDYDNDKKKGIYHLFYGNERGIVKRIQFKKSDNPHIRAANIANNFNDSQGTTKILRQVYDATVEMFGNNLFAVGSQLRIVPSLGGGDDTVRMIELVDDLGIGGYFIVLDREDRVESGKYQTDLQVKWVSPANKKKGGRLSFGDEEHAIRVKRSRKKVKSGKSNVNTNATTGGDINKNKDASSLKARFGPGISGGSRIL